MNRLLLIPLVLFLLSCDKKDKHGCLDSQACNYDSNATIENNSCEYMDNCGVCDNDPTNDCGQDCADEWGGDAIEDMCGTCDDDSTNNCIQDCANVWGGTSWESDCGCVSIDNSGDDCDDCAGVPNGNAEILTYWYDADNDGLGTGESSEFCSGTVETGWVLNNYDEDDNCTSNIHDCAGVCDGTAFENECGCIGGTTGLDEDFCYICIDNDGNEYEIVLIGQQIWMKENLKVTRYNDGSEIPTGYSNSDWGNLSTGAYAVYDNNESNADTYGYLYNWYAVEDSRGVCPEEWHIPTDAEIKQLEMYLGMSQSEADDLGYRGTNEGSKLAGRADLWDDGVLKNNPEFGTSGFNLLPGGYRLYDGGYYGMGSSGDFWSSTENGNSNAWYRILYYYYSEVARDGNYKSYGFSVRCIKN